MDNHDSALKCRQQPMLEKLLEDMLLSEVSGPPKVFNAQCLFQLIQWMEGNGWPMALSVPTAKTQCGSSAPAVSGRQTEKVTARWQAQLPMPMASRQTGKTGSQKPFSLDKMKVGLGGELQLGSEFIELIKKSLPNTTGLELFELIQ
ncbi:hypothetical protein NL676_024790 [Syzygium grande]|nr:hypothetical protein NL676_024790 [Syzygium grande]